MESGIIVDIGNFVMVITKVKRRGNLESFWCIPVVLVKFLTTYEN